MQRIIDVIVSFFSLVILSPLFIPIVIVLMFTGEREIFYIQERVGRRGIKFGLLKFATMLKDSPNIGAKEITLRNDPRVLPFGKFLRITKLNELPQLWNVLVGDMSIVGPRPMVPSTFSHYTEAAQQKLNLVRPGLTGIGSIVFRDEESYLAGRDNPIDFYRQYIIPYKCELEIWFIENNTLWMYINIIIVTAWVVIFKHSKIVDVFFGDMPKMPEILKLAINKP